jgi:hypothetical protein
MYQFSEEALRTQSRVALGAACMSASGIYVLAAFLPGILNDPDTFLHISIGEWILKHGRFPNVDPFSYTKFGQRWIATDWLSEIALAIFYEIGKWRGIVEIVAVTCGLISGVLTFYLARIVRLSVALGIPVSIILLLSPQFLARPVIFSFLLISIWIVIILELEDKGWTKPLGYILIPVMLLWANVHASFTFGLVILYFFLCTAIYEAYTESAAGTLRHLIILLVAVTAAALISPYGPLSALRTIRLMSIPALAQINEWAPPDFLHDPIHLASIVGVFGILAYSGISLRGPRLFTLLMVTVFALEHKRGLALFGVVIPLLLARPISMWAPRVGVQSVLDPVARFINRRTGAIAVACVAIVSITGVVHWMMGSPRRPPSDIAPEAALAAAQVAGVNGHVFNAYNFGGYLIFNGVPTFVDGRVGLYGDAFLKRYFDAMRLTDAHEAVRLLTQYDVSWALLRPGDPIVFMLETKGWVQLYRDDSAIVFAKRGHKKSTSEPPQ